MPFVKDRGSGDGVYKSHGPLPIPPLDSINHFNYKYYSNNNKNKNNFLDDNIKSGKENIVDISNNEISWLQTQSSASDSIALAAESVGVTSYPDYSPSSEYSDMEKYISTTKHSSLYHNYDSEMDEELDSPISPHTNESSLAVSLEKDSKMDFNSSATDNYKNNGNGKLNDYGGILLEDDSKQTGNQMMVNLNLPKQKQKNTYTVSVNSIPPSPMREIINNNNLNYNALPSNLPNVPKNVQESSLESDEEINFSFIHNDKNLDDTFVNDNLNNNSTENIPVKSSTSDTKNEIIESSLIRKKILLDETSIPKWNAKQVSRWIESIGYSNYMGIFEKNKISGLVLMHLNFNVLADIGINSDNDKYRILKEIKRLVNSSDAATLKKQLKDLTINNEYNINSYENSNTSKHSTSPKTPQYKDLVTKTFVGSGGLKRVLRGPRKAPFDIIRSVDQFNYPKISPQPQISLSSTIKSGLNAITPSLTPSADNYFGQINDLNKTEFYSRNDIVTEQTFQEDTPVSPPLGFKLDSKQASLQSPFSAGSSLRNLFGLRSRTNSSNIDLTKGIGNVISPTSSFKNYDGSPLVSSPDMFNGTGIPINKPADYSQISHSYGSSLESNGAKSLNEMYLSSAQLAMMTDGTTNRKHSHKRNMSSGTIVTNVFSKAFSANSPPRSANPNTTQGNSVLSMMFGKKAQGTDINGSTTTGNLSSSSSSSHNLDSLNIDDENDLSLEKGTNNDITSNIEDITENFDNLEDSVNDIISTNKSSISPKMLHKAKRPPPLIIRNKHEPRNISSESSVKDKALPSAAISSLDMKTPISPGWIQIYDRDAEEMHVIQFPANASIESGGVLMSSSSKDSRVVDDIMERIYNRFGIPIDQRDNYTIFGMKRKQIVIGQGNRNGLHPLSAEELLDLVSMDSLIKYRQKDSPSTFEDEKAWFGRARRCLVLARKDRPLAADTVRHILSTASSMPVSPITNIRNGSSDMISTPTLTDSQSMKVNRPTDLSNKAQSITKQGSQHSSTTVYSPFSATIENSSIIVDRAYSKEHLQKVTVNTDSSAPNSATLSPALSSKLMVEEPESLLYTNSSKTLVNRTDSNISSQNIKLTSLMIKNNDSVDISITTPNGTSHAGVADSRIIDPNSSSTDSSDNLSLQQPYNRRPSSFVARQSVNNRFKTRRPLIFGDRALHDIQIGALSRRSSFNKVDSNINLSIGNLGYSNDSGLESQIDNAEYVSNSLNMQENNGNWLHKHRPSVSSSIWHVDGNSRPQSINSAYPKSITSTINCKPFIETDRPSSWLILQNLSEFFPNANISPDLENRVSRRMANLETRRMSISSFSSGSQSINHHHRNHVTKPLTRTPTTIELLDEETYNGRLNRESLLLAPEVARIPSHSSSLSEKSYENNNNEDFINNNGSTSRNSITSGHSKAASAYDIDFVDYPTNSRKIASVTGRIYEVDYNSDVDDIIVANERKNSIIGSIADDDTSIDKKLDLPIRRSASPIGLENLYVGIKKRQQSGTSLLQLLMEPADTKTFRVDSSSSNSNTVSSESSKRESKGPTSIPLRRSSLPADGLGLKRSKSAEGLNYNYDTDSASDDETEPVLRKSNKINPLSVKTSKHIKSISSASNLSLRNHHGLGVPMTKQHSFHSTRKNGLSIRARPIVGVNPQSDFLYKHLQKTRKNGIKDANKLLSMNRLGTVESGIEAKNSSYSNDSSSNDRSSSSSQSLSLSSFPDDINIPVVPEKDISKDFKKARNRNSLVHVNVDSVTGVPNGLVFEYVDNKLPGTYCDKCGQIYNDPSSVCHHIQQNKIIVDKVTTKRKPLPSIPLHNNDTKLHSLPNMSVDDISLNVSDVADNFVENENRIQESNHNENIDRKSLLSDITNKSLKISTTSILSDSSSGHKSQFSISKHDETWMNDSEDFNHTKHINTPISAPAGHRDSIALGDGQIFNWTQGPLIGHGSFGKVYYGINHDTGDIMAVKQVRIPKRTALLRHALENDNEPPNVHATTFKDLRGRMVDSLLSEIRLLRELDHPNIVRYLGYELKPSKTINVFLEYVSGGSVASTLASRGRFAEKLVVNITGQVLHGLEYLHDRFIIHRDIKGGNILLDDHGIAKISDFGISKKNARMAYRYNSQMSILAGSVHWMAPEVVLSKGYSAKVDIWSVGCLVVEMLTASSPWKMLDEMQTVYKLGHGNKPFLPSDISAPLKHALELCLMTNPDLRPTARDLQYFFPVLPDFVFDESCLLGFDDGEDDTDDTDDTDDIDDETDVLESEDNEIPCEDGIDTNSQMIFEIK